MRKQNTNFGKPNYSASAAVYQPDQGQLRRTLTLVVLLLTVLLIGLATRAHADDGPADYRAPKGGICAPSTSHAVENSGFLSTADLGLRS